MYMAVNIVIKTPTARVRAKPFTTDVVSKYNTKHVSNVVIFESLIDGQALDEPSLIACANVLPCLNSSFILAKIKIFASTAIPIDSINPAIPARVKVIGRDLNIASEKAV